MVAEPPLYGCYATSEQVTTICWDRPRHLSVEEFVGLCAPQNKNPL
jgi:hypothetical protein